MTQTLPHAASTALTAPADKPEWCAAWRSHDNHPALLAHPPGRFNTGRTRS